MIEVLKSKIHRATVTQTNLDYEGSITIDRELMDAAGLRLWEAVEVYNLASGSRFKTYVIEGRPGSGEICINGAAARLADRGDLVIIAAYRFVPEGQPVPEPRIVLVDEKNRPRS
jgi:aspartate 1-decarboxylase